MKHAHADLIIKWANNMKTKFEIAYGAGSDFVWCDADINDVIKNNSKMTSIRVKKCRGTERYDSFNQDELNEFNNLCLLFRVNQYQDKITFLTNLTDDEFKQVLLKVQENLRFRSV